MRNKKNKISGPLTTQELEKADTCLIRRAQTGVDLESKEAHQLGLTVLKNISLGLRREYLENNQFSFQGIPF